MPTAGTGTGEFVRLPLGEGVTLHVLPTDKFKTITVQVVLRRQLQASEVAANACIPFVLRRGTERLPDTQAIARFLENLYGADFHVDSLKIGETQLLLFDLDVVAGRYLGGGDEPLREGLRFLGDVLLRPRLEEGAFRAAYVRQEADVLRRKIEGLINNKRQYALERLRQEMCAEEPFGLHRYGTVDGLNALEPRGLFAHYERILKESPVDVFVVGEVDPAVVREWVAEALPVPRGNVVWPPAPVVRVPEKVREVVDEDDVHQAVIALGCRTPLRYSDDGYERVMVYNGILGGFPHSKLFLNVRERASLAYFAASRLDGSKGIIMATAGIDPSRYGQARAIMERQLEDMAAGRITDDELEATQRALIHQLRTVADSADGLIGHELVGMTNGRVRPPHELIEDVQRVGREDVAAVAEGVKLDTVYLLTRAQEGDSSRGSSAMGQ